MSIVTILGTGIRRGEVINLQWSDIDLIKQYLFLVQVIIPLAARNKTLSI
jgi:integrase